MMEHRVGMRDEIFHDGLAQQIGRQQALRQDEVVEASGA